MFELVGEMGKISTYATEKLKMVFYLVDLVIGARDGEKLCSISGDSQIICESWQIKTIIAHYYIYLAKK